MEFKEGMMVIKRLHGAGVVSEEKGLVKKVSGDRVWLRGDEDMTGDSAFVNGKKEGVFGFWEEIIISAIQ